MADLIKGLDGPRTAQQELFYGLEDSAAIISWSVIELTDMASKSNEGKRPPKSPCMTQADTH